MERKLHTYSIAFQNLKAQRTRTIFMIFFVFLMSAAFFFSTILMKNMKQGIQNTTEKMGADIIVVPKEGTEGLRNSLFKGSPCTIYFERNWVSRIQDMEGVERVSPQMYLSTLASSCCDAAIQIIAYEPETDFVVKPWIEKEEELELEEGEIVVGYNIAGQPGATLKLYNTNFKIAAKLEKTGMGYDNSVFMSFDSVYRLKDSETAKENLKIEDLKQNISMLMVDAKDKVAPGVLKADIQKADSGRNIYACTADELMSGIAEQVEKLTGYGALLTGLLVAATALALISIFAITINERKYEFGILYAIGAKKSQVIQIIMTEALVISLSGGVAGSVTAGGAVFIFKNMVRMKFDIPYMDTGLSYMVPIALLGIGIALITGITATLCSLYGISVKEPYRLIRENE